MVTIKEVMNNGILKQLKLIAGANGVDLAVENVAVIENPNFMNWMKSNTLLLTSLYLYRDSDTKQCQLLQNLIRSSCIGILIKLNLSVSMLSKQFLQIADECSFPVYVIPDNITYSEVIGEIYNAILADRNPKRIQEKFFKDIFFEMYDDTKILRERGRAINAFSEENAYLIISVIPSSSVIKSDKKTEKLSLIISEISQFCLAMPLIKNCTVVNCGDSSILVLEGSDPNNLQKSINRIIPHIEQSMDHAFQKGSVKVGIGNPGTDIQGVKSSFRNSRLSIESGQIINRDQICYNYENVEFESFILNCINSDPSYFEEIVKEIENPNLMDTFKTFLSCNCDVDETAKKLFVHPNTVKYRLRNIMEKTGLDYRNINHMMKLYITTLYFLKKQS